LSYYAYIYLSSHFGRESQILLLPYYRNVFGDDVDRRSVRLWHVDGEKSDL